MSDYNSSRRDMIKATGIGILGFAGLSASSIPVAGHPSLNASATDLLGPIQVPPDSEAGFNFPYYLYVPETTQDEPLPILVEPNNTGTATDDFEEHRSVAQQLSQGQLGWTRTYSEALTVPLLVPAFPRPLSEPVDGTHYVHALDETTMNLDGGELDRIDLQLVNMINHAQQLLDDMSYPVADEVMLHGFSASGNFVNRFTALHPDIVRSVTAGGVNGTLLLPLEHAKGHTLNYHIGIADIEEITGEPFDEEAWRDVPQFIYMGGEDDNDTIPYDDAWNDKQRQIALDVYGEDMQDDRMPYCESVYENSGANARFEIYDGVGHSTPLEIQEDIVDFHRGVSGLKDISFGTLPAAGDTTVNAHVDTYEDEERFDIRVQSNERGDITARSTTITTGDAVDVTVDLSTAIEQGEMISVIMVPTGMTSQEDSVASVTRKAAKYPSIEVTGKPTASNHTVTIKYAVGAGYESESPIHVYISQANGGSSQMLGTFPPGTTSEETFDLNPGEINSSLENGTELEASLVDVDTDDTIASDIFVVGDGSQTESDISAVVGFGSQPTDGNNAIDIEYSVSENYEPERFLTLQLTSEDGTRALLAIVEPGVETSATFSLDKIPLGAGAGVKANIVDQGVIAQAQTVVVGDTDNAVELQFTNVPSPDDPSTTVEYNIDEGYQPNDALTLRAYADGLPGTSSGEPLTLLSAGDGGTESFSVGEDVKIPEDDLLVAIVDDVPLAIASSGQGAEGVISQEQSDEDEGGTETSVDTDETQNGTTGETGPGFGIGSALASMGGLGYLLNRRLSNKEEDAVQSTMPDEEQS